MDERLPIETDVLQALREVMEEDFQPVLEDYLQQCEELWQGAKIQFDEADFELLRRTAHTFKGSSMSIGAMQLVSHLAELEQAAAEADPERIAALIAGADLEVVRVVTALAEWRG